MEPGLSSADEDFLEQNLADKHKELPAAASQLLARIPTSKFVTQLRSTALEVLRIVDSEKERPPKKAEPAFIQLDPGAPEKIQLPASKPVKGFGEKASIVIQLLELVPLATWTEAWNTSPAQIVEATLANEWKNGLLEGWVRAAVWQSSAEWADLLFQPALAAEKNDHLPGLLAAMHPQAAEAHLSDLLKANDARFRLIRAPVVTQARHSWSPEFSRTVLDWLRKVPVWESNDWQTRNHLAHFAPRLAPDVLSETASGWPVDSNGWDSWRSSVDALISLAQFRLEMVSALRERK